MTVGELSELLHAFEEKFDVTASAPIAVSVPPAGENDEDETGFDVVLLAEGAKKIAVMKEVRSLTGLGLKDAKELIESIPRPILKGASKEEAEEAKETLEAAGAKVKLK